MNLEKRFIEITNFLKGHIDLANHEALDYYPFIPEQYKNWVSEINTFSQMEKISLENELNSSKIQTTDYNDFLATIQKLCTTTYKAFKVKELDNDLGKKISRKKKHEITIINEQMKEKGLFEFIDIGSGAGHLSSLLLDQGGKNSICLDTNTDYQRIGITKLKRYRPEILKKLTFKEAYIDDKTQIHISPSQTLIGLHACGDLSVDLINIIRANESGSLLNYSCCYHKLNSKNLNLSSLARKEGIELNNFSLTLAAKGFKPQTQKSFDQKLKVKRYRYALHMLNKKYLNKDFSGIGNGLKKDYDDSFENFVSNFSPESLKTISRKEVNNFFKLVETQKEINSLISLGIVRSALARVIELYIILDRAIYLKEAGFKVELVETFDRALSPRNLSLFAQRL